MVNHKLLLGAFLSLMVVGFGAFLPGKSFADPEAMGRVMDIYPDSGILVINGQKYMVSQNVRVAGRIDPEHTDSLNGLKRGMNVLYGFGYIDGARVISEIVVTGDE